MKKIIQSALLVTCSLFMASPALAATEVVINGSTTVLPVIQKASEAFMQNNPTISLSISGGGSGNGIKALTEGICHIAMASRDIKANEVESAKTKGIEPYRIAIAYDAMVPVVHPSNTVKNLTVQQLQDIYAGKVTNWKELGGSDDKIVVVSRDTSSGTYETWADLIMKKEKVAPSALLQASNGAVVTTIAKNKRAIGYIGFGYLNDSVKSVSVDGAMPSPEAVINKQWPISRELYLFTNGMPQNEVKQFIDFVLDPQKGQKIVGEVGYIPL